jgi:hypothetical protein
VARAGEGEGVLDRVSVEPVVALVRAVLTDDGEEVAQQRPVLAGQRLGHLVDRRGRSVATAVGAHPRVAAPIRRPRGALSAV